MCEWSPQTRKIVKAVDANQAFPHLVVSFYETKFDFLHGVPPTLNGLNEIFYLTRALERWAINENVSFNPKLLVVRLKSFEEYILNARAAPIDRRRRTVAATPRIVGNIPFGARGRKRRVNSNSQIQTVAY